MEGKKSISSRAFVFPHTYCSIFSPWGTCGFDFSLQNIENNFLNAFLPFIGKIKFLRCYDPFFVQDT
jgi:hypothetical protein